MTDKIKKNNQGDNEKISKVDITSCTPLNFCTVYRPMVQTYSINCILFVNLDFALNKDCSTVLKL